MVLVAALRRPAGLFSRPSQQSQGEKVEEVSDAISAVAMTQGPSRKTHRRSSYGQRRSSVPQPRQILDDAALGHPQGTSVPLRDGIPGDAFDPVAVPGDHLRSALKVGASAYNDLVTGRSARKRLAAVTSPSPARSARGRHSRRARRAGRSDNYVEPNGKAWPSRRAPKLRP
jgi:hypothetical protein